MDASQTVRRPVNDDAGLSVSRKERRWRRWREDKNALRAALVEARRIRQNVEDICNADESDLAHEQEDHLWWITSRYNLVILRNGLLWLSGPLWTLFDMMADAFDRWMNSPDMHRGG